MNKYYKLHKYRHKLYYSNNNEKLVLYEQKFLEYQEGGVICDSGGLQVRKPDPFNNIRMIEGLNTTYHEKTYELLNQQKYS